MVKNTFQKPWPLKCYIHGKCSYKVLFPSGPNLWPRFRLREICREQGLAACGRERNTQSPDVRLYLFLFHLSIGTCPLLPQISLAWSHYTTVYPFFKEGEGRKEVAVAVFMCSERKGFLRLWLGICYLGRDKHFQVIQVKSVCQAVVKSFI